MLCALELAGLIQVGRRPAEVVYLENSWARNTSYTVVNFGFEHVINGSSKRRKQQVKCGGGDELENLGFKGEGLSLGENEICCFAVLGI
ncbi:hypothetical protein ACFX2B_029330 [Malus domestica]